MIGAPLAHPKRLYMWTSLKEHWGSATLIVGGMGAAVKSGMTLYWRWRRGQLAVNEEEIESLKKVTSETHEMVALLRQQIAELTLENVELVRTNGELHIANSALTRQLEQFELQIQKLETELAKIHDG